MSTMPRPSTPNPLENRAASAVDRWILAVLAVAIGLEIVGFILTRRVTRVEV